MSSIEELIHPCVPLGDGGKVLVLNTGAVITPEAQAMLAALHSRSIGGILEHLKTLAEKGSDKFMSSFYVGYGHQSIGDNGSISLFIEGVSMLVAKAIQDSRLYNGQESSTRYIDFAEQPFMDPLGTEESKSILEDWRAFYLRGLQILPEYLKQKYPIQESDKPETYEKAIMARAFDIMRSFLVAGASTNLAWHGPVRVIRDRVPILRTHPLAEMRAAGEALDKALKEAYPSSFDDKPKNDEVKLRKYLERKVAAETYLTMAGEDLAYLDLDDCPAFTVTRDSLDHALLAEHSRVLKERPMKVELPKWLDEAGEMQFTYLLDFASFRDMQRHRAVIQRMPLLTTRYGFHSWYLDEMPEELRVEAVEFIAKQKARIGALDTTPEVRQYYIAMGFLTANRVTGTLPAHTYHVELRSGSTVHPTLRILAQQMGDALEQSVGVGNMALYIDREPNRFDVKRGEHDIVRIDQK